MRPRRIIRKVVELGKKMNNPPFFWYSVFHYLKKDIPARMAEKYWRKNFISYKSENEFFVPTYDKSNQIVHPDLMFFKGKYWLAVTPYPYGMEEYENPCLYCGMEIDHLIAIDENPIERQSKHDIGYHLSDPCIFEYRGHLICAYRENTRTNGNEDNFIYYKERLDDGHWNERKLISSSTEDQLLSPAFYVESSLDNETVHMIHVRRTKQGSCLIHSELDTNLKVHKSNLIECTGLPDGYYIWHIGITYSNGNKNGCTEDYKYGLFLLRNNMNEYKLCLAECKGDYGWAIKKDIRIPESINNNMLHPYKSCFIPNMQEILLNYVDKKHRYRLSRIVFIQ